MRSLSAAELLELWERGRAEPLARRALTLLAGALPDTASEVLAALSIGRRDAYLLELREQVFGSELSSTTFCPRCGERLEMTFETGDIRQPALPHQAANSFRLSPGELEVRFRLPNSNDLAALTTAGADANAARQLLLERCLLSIEKKGEHVPLEGLSEPVISAVVAEMARLDPQASVQLDLVCPACGHWWQAAFDIVSFFWSELNAWAQRLLRDVHTLAAVYGWREADILAMSATRRGIYLELARE
jgi:hypothetical protein